MELRINTGAQVIPIVRDGQQVGTISVNPYDVGFVDKFYRALTNYETLAADIADQMAALKQKDVGGVIALTLRVADQVRADIDNLFGPGTADLIIGPGAAGTPDIYAQFYNGLSELIGPERRQQMEQYLPEGDELAGGDGAQDA